ncbi:anti-sigma factor [Sinorhizobium terangae]|uniref:Regulator of SigK n=1 Tax=Sinorhizobium terangae TaxID=110322 RepID=A0A6N7LBG2_SINTE|nr:anti-sigma factor [Sinorhizobium terangae]MBB4183777.1 anti-sigma-K factor RskA [Sinorhizobium terangae]MQX15193.1 anti-sigma factor [Sinorhizobium terangae]WFU47921.1 anti-sigma factor [Sinorhizobium terangae]
MTTQNPESGDFRRDEVIAGEYVLGVLSEEDRRKVEARMASDRNFAAMVDRWQHNLASFDDAYEAVRPPAHVFAAVESRIFPPPAASPRVGFWNSLLLWRSLAVASLAAVAIMGASMAGLFSEPQSQPLVAELSGEGNAINLVARFDRASGSLKLTPVAARQAEQKSLELWLIEGDNPAVSLGVLPQSGEGEILVPPEMRTRFDEGSTLAVSVEPLGGSPTGAPTGAVVAQGTARHL